MFFPQFSLFPPEIQNLILESCPPNDKACLRLTCKSLYSALPCTPGTKSKISLDQTDFSGPLCGHTGGILDWRQRYEHKKICHSLSWAAIKAHNESLGRKTNQMSRKCRTGWRSDHCECYVRHRRLHNRLRGWMPKGLNYCGVCERFTRRKRGHQGRCYHGEHKTRTFIGHYWTHTSRGGAFGRKIWKKWFNNRAMNRLERRLRGVGEAPGIVRKGTQRYEMRKLRGKVVDTKKIRGYQSAW